MKSLHEHPNMHVCACLVTYGAARATYGALRCHAALYVAVRFLIDSASQKNKERVQCLSYRILLKRGR